MSKKIILYLIIILVLVSLLPVFNCKTRAENIYFINLEGTIDSSQYSFLKRGIKEAENSGADLLIMEINTLGGYVNSALNIRDLILNSSVKIDTFVNGRAWSAGALIALSGENLYMAPGSSIGAAETRPKEEKYISALRKEFAATAEKRNKDSLIAEAMVDEDIVIEGIIEKGKLLTLTAEEAVKLKIADQIVNSRDDLFFEKNIEISEINFITKSNIELVSSVLTNPIVSTLLLVVGFSGLIFEILTPGFGIGGTVGITAFLLFFAGHLFVGSAGWGLMLLFLLGIILIILEVFVIPGFGVAGISGIAAVMTSLFFFFPDKSTAVNVLAAVVIMTVLSAVILIKLLGVSKFWKRISLSADAEKYFSHSSRKDLVGKRGIAVTPLRPSGIIEIDSERLDVVSEGGFVDKEVKVEIISVIGSRIVVKESKESEE
ncbi:MULTISPECIES: nodulation protein NfeD [unclassified Halanaerobium]|uniref:NfeD family protein n=1 Tax=unclassified Halanaerobium TaxID=2641197 RepID=UPI000DF29243|nr:MULTISPECIES: NfeD family protein [unclassified Halanaerobium]RCW45395.1 membrane-bound serine protease (ClpP class) [Halanaerobium sp. MA284_MarDTE_T2]RCW82573.1 membrane-bound serine protease (ClpP class) [Halanaerobium sp. DL-01]